MTPFDSWYAANVAPALKDAPAGAQKAAKASAAQIWNGALDAVNKHFYESAKKSGEALNTVNFSLPYIDHLRARVTP